MTSHLGFGFRLEIDHHFQPGVVHRPPHVHAQDLRVQGTVARWQRDELVRSPLPWFSVPFPWCSSFCRRWSGYGCVSISERIPEFCRARFDVVPSGFRVCIATCECVPRAFHVDRTTGTVGGHASVHPYASVVMSLVTATRPTWRNRETRCCMRANTEGGCGDEKGGIEKFRRDAGSSLTAASVDVAGLSYSPCREGIGSAGDVDSDHCCL